MTNTPSTSTGLKENVAALLCYVLGWLTGIIFYILENKNPVVRFHAVQSIVVFGVITIAEIIFGWIPYINVVLNPLIGIFAFILWIVLMVKAYRGGTYHLPVAGPLAENFEQWLMKNLKF